MRKILIILILFFLIVLLENIISFPSVLAVVTIDEKEVITESPQCCKLKHNIKGWSAPSDGYGPGIFIGPPPGAVSRSEICPADYNYIEDPNWAGFCTVDAIKSFGDLVTLVAMTIVGVALIFAGITFLTAAGNPERVSKAKNIFLYSLIGILVIVLAELIPGLVRYFLGI